MRWISNPQVLRKLIVSRHDHVERAGKLLLLVNLVLAIGGCSSSTREDPISARMRRAKSDSGDVMQMAPNVFQSLDNPAREGWKTEVLQEEAKHILKKLFATLTRGDKLERSHVSRFVTRDFSCSSLRPASLKTVYEFDALHVARRTATKTEISKAGKVELHRGANGLSKAFAQSLAKFKNISQLRVEFKIFGVTKSGSTIETRQYVTISGLAGKHQFEQNATWLAQWRKKTAGGSLRLRSLVVQEYEEARIESGFPTLFSDCTEAVLKKNLSYQKQIIWGTNHWLEQLAATLGTGIKGFQGVAVGDVNNDGLDDIYLCQPGGLPNRLYVQNRDGTATDTSQESRVDWCDLTQGALLVDLDNDGDQDLVISTGDALLLMANNGQGHFALRSRESSIKLAFSPTAVDYDDDGDLDLYLCQYSSDTNHVGTIAQPATLYDANNGGRNVLLRNDGDWHFTNATEEAGLNVGNDRFSYAASWEDYDNDGDLDLYVANDFGPNNLFRNEHGRFVDVAQQSGAEDRNFGMSVAWGDYDRDGRMDVYISNMFSAAGNRIMTQSQFRPEDSSLHRTRLLQMARGNTLLANVGDGKFRDVSVNTGVALGRWAWGAKFVDINRDGWEDLVVANGFVTGRDSSDL